MEKYIVYKHTSPSGKVYIGITKRKAKDRWKYGHGYVHNEYFYNAIKKYGWNNIEHEIIESELSLEEASLKEKELISLYTNLGISYNIAEGGIDGNTKKRTDEEKEHLSIYLKEFYKNHEHPFRGKHHSDENKKLISAINKKRWEENYEELYNRLVTAIKVGVFDTVTGGYQEFNSEKEASKCLNIKETTFRRHIKDGSILGNYILIPIEALTFEEALKKAYNKEKLNIHCGGQEIPVVQLDLKGNYIKSFSSAKEASSETSCSMCGIGKACRGEIKHSGGYFWMFEYEYNQYRDAGNIDAVLESMQNKLQQRKEICITPIMQMTLDGSPIQIFKSSMDIKRKFGFDSSIICKCCKGKLSKAYGFTWKYIPKEEYCDREYLRKH